MRFFDSRCWKSLLKTLPPLLHCRIFYFVMCMALQLVRNRPLMFCYIATHLISMPKPRCSLLLMTSHSNPFPTSSTTPLPQFRIRLTPPHLSRFLKWLPCRRTNPVHKTLIVPESTRLKYQPLSRLANPAPALTVLAVAADPAGCVEVGIETKFLFVRD